MLSNWNMHIKFYKVFTIIWKTNHKHKYLSPDLELSMDKKQNTLFILLNGMDSIHKCNVCPAEILHDTASFLCSSVKWPFLETYHSPWVPECASSQLWVMPDKPPCIANMLLPSTRPLHTVSLLWSSMQWPFLLPCEYKYSGPINTS